MEWVKKAFPCAARCRWPTETSASRGRVRGHARPRTEGDSARGGGGSNKCPQRRHVFPVPAGKKPSKSAQSDTNFRATDSAAADRRAQRRSANASAVRAAPPMPISSQWSAARCAAAVRTCSSSARAARLRCSDAALVNRTRSKGERNRTIHKPAARPSAWRSMAARIWRLMRVRVTALRACRLGTTAPSQRPPGDRSSTGGADSVASPVDNCGFNTHNARFAPVPGLSDRWCKAKCSLLARLRMRNTRSKSSERTMRRITLQLQSGNGRLRCRARARSGRTPHRVTTRSGLKLPNACGPWRGVR